MHHGETIYANADMNDEEKKEFLESFNVEQFGKLSEFFETMPKVRHEIKVKNPKTKKTSEVVLEGLADFFV